MLKAICFSRASVIDIDEKITSIFLASSEGMMPSQATSLISHCAFICSQSLWIRSTSKPDHCPLACFSVNGG
ncbi:hypothetical protein D3C76_1705730 [compost metagenome]